MKKWKDLKNVKVSGIALIWIAFLASFVTCLILDRIWGNPTDSLFTIVTGSILLILLLVMIGKAILKKRKEKQN
jgi:polyferredoxin